MCDDYVSGQRDQLFCDCLHLVRATSRKPSVDADVLAFRPSVLFKPLTKYGEAGSYFTVPLGEANYQYADPPRAIGLLRPNPNRPRRRATEQRDELTPPDHSITSSARASRDGGTV